MDVWGAIIAILVGKKANNGDGDMEEWKVHHEDVILSKIGSTSERSGTVRLRYPGGTGSPSAERDMEDR